LLAAQTEMSCSILIEHDLHRKIRDGCALVQVFLPPLLLLHSPYADEGAQQQRGGLLPMREAAAHVSFSEEQAEAEVEAASCVPR